MPKPASVLAPRIATPTAAPLAALAVTAAPVVDWRAKLIDTKTAKTNGVNDAEAAKLRFAKELEEARWAGVPAWKRTIIEKAENDKK